MKAKPHQLPAEPFAALPPDADATMRVTHTLEYIAAMLYRLDAKLTDIGTAIGNLDTEGLPIKIALHDAVRAIHTLKAPGSR